MTNNFYFPKICAAALFGFSAMFSTQAVQAGDLFYADEGATGYYGSDRGSFGGSGSLKDAPLAPDYKAPATPAYPLTPSYKDQPYSNDLPKNSIQYRGNGYGRFGNNRGYCVPRWQIRENLRRHGWFGFHNRRIRRRVIKINAERGDGCIFTLRVDRCSGEILRKKLVSRPASRYQIPYNNRGRYRDRGYGYKSGYGGSYNIY